MPTWLKLVLAFLGIGLLGGGLVIGGFVWWVSANKDDLAREGKAAMAEGTEYGQTHTKDECVDEGLRRLDACGSVGFVCEATNKMRMEACIRASAAGTRPGRDVCADTPGRDDIMKSAMWANEECRRRGRAGSQPCGRLMQGIQEVCRRP